MWPKKLKKVPAVKKVMTPFPFHVTVDEPLEQARDLMLSEEIHHLPVVQGDTVKGVITYRALERTLEGSASESATGTVADVPLEEVLLVDLSEPLDRVLMDMAERHLGVTLVVKEGRLAGIFTHTDACRCLAESLRLQFPPRGDDEVA